MVSRDVTFLDLFSSCDLEPQDGPQRCRSSLTAQCLPSYWMADPGAPRSDCL